LAVVPIWLSPRSVLFSSGSDKLTNAFVLVSGAKELEFKNKELTTNVMYLLKKNEFISEISNKLRDVDCNTDIVQPKIIVDIISELDKNTSNEVWTEFETRFQEIYGDFYKRLNEKFPDLTPNDLKLSAFLKLNMSSKEISAITYQSTETLKTARHRLRKKLGLSREDNLVAFFEPGLTHCQLFVTPYFSSCQLFVTP